MNLKKKILKVRVRAMFVYIRHHINCSVCHKTGPLLTKKKLRQIFGIVKITTRDSV